MYKDLVANNDTYSLNTPNTIVPTPSNSDYAQSYLIRYFIQRVSDLNGFVYEISNSEYETYSENPYWKADSMRWRISGPIDEVYDSNGKLIDKGVINSNKASLSLISLKIKNISLYLPNLRQFYK
jgi:hypothetical protein